MMLFTILRLAMTMIMIEFLARLFATQKQIEKRGLEPLCDQRA